MNNAVKPWSLMSPDLLAKVYIEIILEIEILVSTPSNLKIELNFKSITDGGVEFKIYETAKDCDSATENPEGLLNKFYFLKYSSSKLSTSQQVMKRIRNCFAHGHFQYDIGKDLFDLKDISIDSKTKGLRTMRSRLGVSDLFSLVNYLKKADV